MPRGCHVAGMRVPSTLPWPAAPALPHAHLPLPPQERERRGEAWQPRWFKPLPANAEILPGEYSNDECPQFEFTGAYMQAAPRPPSAAEGAPAAGCWLVAAACLVRPPAMTPSPLMPPAPSLPLHALRCRSRGAGSRLCAVELPRHPPAAGQGDAALVREQQLPPGPGRLRLEHAAAAAAAAIALPASPFAPSLPFACLSPGTNAASHPLSSPSCYCVCCRSPPAETHQSC